MILPLLLLAGVVGVGWFLLQQDQTPIAPAESQPIVGTNDAGSIAPNPIIGPPTDETDTGVIVSSSWGNMITSDISTWPTGDRIWDICRAIAEAEGYNVNNDAPFHLNNPGDLSPGDEHGFPTSGPAEFHGGSSIIHFANPVDGWNALYTKINDIVLGYSKVYGQKWTVSQIAAKYAGNSAVWAKNVGRILGIDPNTQGFFDYVQS